MLCDKIEKLRSFFNCVHRLSCGRTICILNISQRAVIEYWSVCCGQQICIGGLSFGSSANAYRNEECATIGEVLSEARGHRRFRDSAKGVRRLAEMGGCLKWGLVKLGGCLNWEIV